MRFQKAIKRMIALGTGAIMVGSSVFAAADLANYPAPFVKDGKFSGVLVVGDKAAAEDVIGISDIIASLQFAATKKVAAAAAGAISVEGDAWKAGTSTKKLELSEDLAAGGINREILSNITTFIQKGDLKALNSGTAQTVKATSPYNQYLYLLGPQAQSNMDSGYVVYSEDDDTDVVGDYLYFKSGRELGRYLLEFTTALESDVDDSAGASSATGLFLTDMQDVDVTILGKKYTIVTAKRLTTNSADVVLTLMGGAGKDTLLEKQTKTYTIGGKDYEVTLNFVDADEAQFVVNGQTTRKLKDGDTDKLSDGTTIGVTDVLYQDYAGGIHSSTFFLGANKLELKDDEIEDGILASSNALKVDDNTIDDALVTIEGSDDNTTFKISRIHINMSADDNFFVPVGGKLSDAIKAAGGTTAEPQVLFTENWDIEYRGLSKETTETVKVTTSGSSEYRLEFLDGDSNRVKLPIAKTTGGAAVLFAEQAGREVINKENRTIDKDDYIILSDSGTSRKRGERPTYVLQYKGADKVTNDNPLLKFKNIGSGNTIEQTYSAATTLVVTGPGGAGGKLATLKVGGSDFVVYNASSVASNDFGLLIDLDASGAINAQSATIGAENINSSTIVITTKGGMEINVTNETANPGGSDTSDIVFLTFGIPDEARDGSARDSTENLLSTIMRFNITASSGEVRMAQDTTTNQSAGIDRRLNLRTPSGKTNIAYAYDSYGSYWTWETPTSAPQLLTIEVPSKQRVPLVYIAAKGASFSEAGASSTDAVTVQRIQVGAAKLASEVADIKAQNAILVGGPCANAAAATVMGNPADCTAGFTPGEGRLELFEHTNGNVAMLVAGYAALDTRNAAQVVANYGDYKANLKGTKVTVKKVNNQLTVAAPATA